MCSHPGVHAPPMPSRNHVPCRSICPNKTRLVHAMSFPAQSPPDILVRSIAQPTPSGRPLVTPQRRDTHMYHRPSHAAPNLGSLPHPSLLYLSFLHSEFSFLAPLFIFPSPSRLLTLSIPLFTSVPWCFQPPIRGLPLPPWHPPRNR